MHRQRDGTGRVASLTSVSAPRRTSARRSSAVGHSSRTVCSSASAPGTTDHEDEEKPKTLIGRIKLFFGVRNNSVIAKLSSVHRFQEPCSRGSRPSSHRQTCGAGVSAAIAYCLPLIQQTLAPPGQGAKLDKKKLAALGTSALLSYGACACLRGYNSQETAPRASQVVDFMVSRVALAGFVSNVNAITLVIISWVTFTKTQGLSPLAPGQWKARGSDV